MPLCQLSIHGVAAASGAWLELPGRGGGGAGSVHPLRLPWEGDRKAQRRDIAVVHGVSTPEVERLDGCLGTVSVLIGSVLLVKLVSGFRLTRLVSTAIARLVA